jgi:hypothetical protein
MTQLRLPPGPRDAVVPTGRRSLAGRFARSLARPLAGPHVVVWSWPDLVLWWPRAVVA